MRKLIFGKGYKKAIPNDYIFAYDFNGDFLDKSSNSNTLLNTNVTFTTGRKLGTQCANFNGSAFLETANNVVYGSNKVSISLWLKSSQTTPAFILEQGSPYETYKSFCILANWGGYVNDFQFTSYDGSYNLRINNQGFSTWTHFLITLDRTQLGANEITIYRNKVIAYRSELIQGNHINNFLNSKLFFGIRKNLNSNYYVGQIQDARGYNRILTAAEIDALYNE